jgi:hypothetical protein
MGLSNNKLKQKQTMRDLVELESLSPPSRTLSFSLETFPNEIFLNIFLMLDVWSIGTVLKTCKHFRFIIYESNIKILVNVCYIGSFNSVVLDTKLVHDLLYLLEFKFRNLGLPFSIEFQQVYPGRKIESFIGYSVNALLWVEQGQVKDKALESLQWFISEYSQTPILLLKGDSIIFKRKKLYQKVRELRSLKVLGVIDGTLKRWSEFQTFNELELVYFATREYIIDKKKFFSITSAATWTIDTRETTFIVDAENLKIIHPSNLV